MLGGVEKVELWTNYPCVQFPRYLEEYYVIKFSYHFYDLMICLIFYRNKWDFPELFLHHTATMALITVSYNINFLIPGAIIMLLHDYTDVCVLIAKIGRDNFSKSWMLKIAWLNMVTMWAYLRLYYFPSRIMVVYYHEMYNNPHPTI